jgi:hypothetical protein
MKALLWWINLWLGKGGGMGDLHYSEDDICFITDGREGDGGDHHDHEIKDPIR